MDLQFKKVAILERMIISVTRVKANLLWDPGFSIIHYFQTPAHAMVLDTCRSFHCILRPF